MLMKLLVPGLLVLSTSFTLSAAPNGLEQPADTSGINLHDTLETPALAVNDPKARLREISSEENFNLNMVALDDMHPTAIRFTREYEAVMGKRLSTIGDRVQPQFQVIESILKQYDLPTELKYLAIVESQLETRARSKMGAVGPWQFMPATARNMGLKITRTVDERRDLRKSTHAAAKYLKYLYKIYGDWPLVIAAYNGGPGNVNKAITRSGSRNFWELERFLPAESRKHVKKYIATQFIMAGHGGLTALTRAELDRRNEIPETPVIFGIEPDESEIAMRPISGRYHSSIMSKHLGMDIEDFLAMNPSFDQVISLRGEFDLKLPADKMEIFVSRKFDIISESMNLLLK